MTLDQILAEAKHFEDVSGRATYEGACERLIRAAYEAGAASNRTDLHHNSYGAPVCQQCGGDPR